MAKSEAEKRAAAAERARNYRARKAAERDAVSRDERDARDAAAPTTMRDAVDASLQAMAKWIVASDGAAVQQAKSLAKQIDVLEHAGDTVRALSAHGRLTAVLDRLGGTPVVRLQHELRSRKLDPPERASNGEGEGEGGQPPTNVSQFTRPAKRRVG